MLVQFAQMGAAFAASATASTGPAVALLSIGEEKSKGTPLVKETHALLAAGRRRRFDFVGNVEGRDFFDDAADVVVTDGFTGNVALKTLEGSLRFLIGALTEILGRPEVAEAAEALLPAPAAAGRQLDPEDTGGAMLLGVDGVCVISHGSSSAVAMVNAITVAHDLAVAVWWRRWPPRSPGLPRRTAAIPPLRSAPEVGEKPDVGRRLTGPQRQGAGHGAR